MERGRSPLVSIPDALKIPARGAADEAHDRTPYPQPKRRVHGTATALSPTAPGEISRPRRPRENPGTAGIPVARHSLNVNETLVAKLSECCANRFNCGQRFARRVRLAYIGSRGLKRRSSHHVERTLIGNSGTKRCDSSSRQQPREIFVGRPLSNGVDDLLRAKRPAISKCDIWTFRGNVRYAHRLRSEEETGRL